MRLGLSSYTYGWTFSKDARRPWSVFSLLDEAERHGVGVVQIADNVPLHLMTECELERLAKRAQELDIALEIGMRGLFGERVERYARIARQLRSSILRIVIDDNEYEPTVDTIIGIVRKCSGVLGDVCLAIENHDRLSAATLRHVVETIDSAHVGICLDTANSFGAGEGIETVVRELGAFTVNLHIKDFHIRRVPSKMGFVVEGRPAGQGQLDIPCLLSSLERLGRCSTAILELWTPEEKSLAETIAKENAWAVQSIDFLKPLLNY